MKGYVRMTRRYGEKEMPYWVLSPWRYRLESHTGRFGRWLRKRRWGLD